jgi:hypothetical protein
MQAESGRFFSVIRPSGRDEGLTGTTSRPVFGGPEAASADHSSSLEVGDRTAAQQIAIRLPESNSVGFGAKLKHRSLIYRGEGQARWSLVPAARRETNWPPPVWVGDLTDTWAQRLVAEAATLLSFCNVADRQGLPIPNGMALRGGLFASIGEWLGVTSTP